jgi:hypothetical protein
MAQRKVLKPFIFRGNPVEVDAIVTIPDERLSYFESQGLVGPMNGSTAPEKSEVKEKSQEAPAPVKATPKRKNK